MGKLLDEIKQTTEDAMRKTKEWSKQKFAFEGFTYFLYDSESLDGRIVPISDFNNIFQSKLSGEEWLRADVSMYSDGKPMYWCFPRIPFTPGLKIEDNTLKLRDYDEETIKDYLDEMYDLEVLGKRDFTLKQKILLASLSIFAGVYTALAMAFTFGGAFSESKGSELISLSLMTLGLIL